MNSLFGTATHQQVTQTNFVCGIAAEQAHWLPHRAIAAGRQYGERMEKLSQVAGQTALLLTIGKEEKISFFDYSMVFFANRRGVRFKR
jgi:hypothetical protein